MATDDVELVFKFPNRSVNIKLKQDEALNLFKRLVGFSGLDDKLILNKVPPIPSTPDLERFIKSQSDYLFTIDDIVDYFLENVNIDKEEKSKWINATRTKVNRIRNNIEKKEDGSWEIEADGLKRTFKFIKNQFGNDQIKQNETINNKQPEEFSQKMIKL